MKPKKNLILLFFLLSYTTLKSYDYDLIIIGAGAAGTKAAVLAYDLGKKVLLVEKSNRIGGGRLWHGDIPFKTLYAFSNKIMTVKELEEEGLVSQSIVHIGQGQVLSRVSKVCNKVCQLLQEKSFSNRDVPIIYGSPQFVDAHTISINDTVISSEKFLIATGARSHIPDIPGINEVPYLIRENFFNLESVPQFPKSIIIIGGGPLGIELAKVLNQCRVTVTLLVKHAVLLPMYDYQVIEQLTNQLLEQGINIVCNVQAQKVQKNKDSFKVDVKNRVGHVSTFKAETLFIACGSDPNTEGLALENAGVTINDNGKEYPLLNEVSKNAIITNNLMQTTAPNIYACGDVTGVNALTRVAYYQAKLAIQNMYASPEKALPSNYRNVPQVLFAHPQELACAGLSEQKALQLYGKDILTYTYSYQSLERAHMDKTENGIAKFICDTNGIVLGVHIFGAYAGKLIDLIHLGEDLTKFTKEEALSISTSPSYRELIREVSHVCKSDVDKIKEDNAQEQPGWLQIILSPLLWGRTK